MAKKFRGAQEANKARAALEAELAELRQAMTARVAALEAERDASAAQAQASQPHAEMLAHRLCGKHYAFGASWMVQASLGHRGRFLPLSFDLAGQSQSEPLQSSTNRPWPPVSAVPHMAYSQIVIKQGGSMQRYLLWSFRAWGCVAAVKDAISASVAETTLLHHPFQGLVLWRRPEVHRHQPMQGHMCVEQSLRSSG